MLIQLTFTVCVLLSLAIAASKPIPLQSPTCVQHGEICNMGAPCCKQLFCEGQGDEFFCAPKQKQLLIETPPTVSGEQSTNVPYV